MQSMKHIILDITPIWDNIYLLQRRLKKMKKTKLIAAMAAATMTLSSMAALPFSVSAANRFPYMLGDLNTDLCVDAGDASTVLHELVEHGFEEDDSRVRVSYVRAHLDDWFPNAVCAAAADANKDGYISKADADLILHHYTLIMSNMEDTETDIGKMFIYIAD